MSEIATINIQDWISRGDMDNGLFKKTVHLILQAISLSNFSNKMILKGGLLLALRYGSQRYTKDIDFSNCNLEVTVQENNVDITEEQLEENLNNCLQMVSLNSSYGIKCNIQKIKKEPKNIENATFPSFEITVSYITNNSADVEKRRFNNKQAFTVVRIDFSLNEYIEDNDVLIVDEFGTRILCYTLPNLLAEKYRSILQQIFRNRQRGNDIYDIYFLYNQNQRWFFLQENKMKILQILLKNSVNKGIDNLLIPTAMQNIEIKSRAGDDYAFAVENIPNAPSFEEAYETVRILFEQLPWNAI